MRFIRQGLAILLTLGFFLSAGPSFAETVFPEKPPAQDFFVDKANVLSEKDKKAINETAALLLKEQQIPLFVVTIDALSSYKASALGVDAYARELFNHWGIGAVDRNYGMLLLVSVGDRKSRIELGAGFERTRDDQSADIMQSLILPAFKRGDYSTGIADGVRGLDAMARGLQLPAPTVPTWQWLVLIGGAIGFVALVMNLFKTGKSGWAWALLAVLGTILFFLMRHAAQGRGSSGGFGGGSSGGGGASGSW